MNIAIVKLAALGDVLRTTCLLKPLHRYYPGANVYWFTQAGAEPLLENNPLIQHIILAGSAVPDISFDWVLGLDDDEASCSLVSSLKTKKRFGAYKNDQGKLVYTPDSAPWFDMGLLNRDADGGLTKANTLKQKNKKSYPQILWDMLKLDGPPDDRLPFMTPSAEALAWARTWTKNNHIKETDFLLGINTSAGSRWPTKQLSIPKTVALLKALNAAMPSVRLVLLGGPEEHERNRTIAKQTPFPLLNPGTTMSLPQFSALIGECRALITSDSLSLHVALAMRRPVVSFFGPTSAVEIELPKPGFHWLPTPSCQCFYLSRCRTNTFCLDTLDVRPVVQTFKEMLS